MTKKAGFMDFSRKGFLSSSMLKFFPFFIDVPGNSLDVLVFKVHQFASFSSRTKRYRCKDTSIAEGG